MSPTLVVDCLVVACDKRGNFYVRGKSHSKAQMTELALAYSSYNTRNSNGNINRFKNSRNITYYTTKTATRFYKTGKLVNRKQSGMIGTGTRSNFKMRHHLYLYHLYLNSQIDQPTPT